MNDQRTSHRSPHHTLMRNQAMGDPQYTASLTNRPSGMIEGFGNTHQYEIWPDTQHPMSGVVRQGAYNNQRRIESEAIYQTGDVADEKQSYYITPLQDNDIEHMVESVLNPVSTSADDRMAKLTSHVQRKSKKSHEYRSAATIAKTRRFFQNELDTHEHREWWVDPDYSDKHLTWR